MTIESPPAHETTDILFVISGSIAAYRSLDVLRSLKRLGHSVSVVMSRNAHHFVTPLSVAALTEIQPRSAFFELDDEASMSHIALARSARLRCVCPASASFLARFAHGLCDDLASTVLITANQPVLFFPAMNPQMWANPLVQRNVALIRDHGHHVVTPSAGETACGEYGEGRLPSVETITDILDHRIKKTTTLDGLRVLVTAGPTHEPLDAVRTISNRSSGVQGYAIARELRDRGADVVLVSGAVQLPTPYRTTCVPITTGRELWHAAREALPVDVAICTAAVADWYAETASEKIKKSSDIMLHWHDNPDTLSNLGHGRDQEGNTFSRPRLLIGFAADTTKHEEYARKKIVEKKTDWLLANDVATGGFGPVKNKILFLQKSSSDGKIYSQLWPLQSKGDIARQLVLSIERWVKPRQ